MQINSLNAGGDASENFPRDGAGFLRQITGMDFVPFLLPEEDGFLAGGDVGGERGDVDHDLVHGDAAEDGAAPAADEDFRTLAGKAALVAIGITHGERGDAHGLRRDEGAAVADAVAGGDLADEGDAGLEGHDGAQFLLERVDRRTAVEGETDARHLERVAGKCDGAGAVEHVDEGGADAGGAEPGDDGLEAGELGGGERLVLVGDGEGGGHGFCFDAREHGDLAHGGKDVLFVEADAAHAGVDGDGDFQRIVTREAFKGNGLFGGGDDGDESAPGDFGALIGKRGAEDVDAGRDDDPGDFGDLDCLGEVCDAEGGDERGEFLHDGERAMAVGVCLYDCHDAGAAKPAVD